MHLSYRVHPPFLTVTTPWTKRSDGLLRLVARWAVCLSIGAHTGAHMPEHALGAVCRCGCGRAGRASRGRRRQARPACVRMHVRGLAVVGLQGVGVFCAPVCGMLHLGVGCAGLWTSGCWCMGVCTHLVRFVVLTLGGTRFGCIRAVVRIAWQLPRLPLSVVLCRLTLSPFGATSCTAMYIVTTELCVRPRR